MVNIELKVPEVILNDMIKEYEIINSHCFVRKDEWQDAISQDFLTTILKEYKKHKPSKNIIIKINKKKEYDREW